MKMTAKVHELIAKFERAESQVAEAISAVDETSTDVLSELDSQLSETFEQLVNAQLNVSGELIYRIRFLTERLKEDTEHESVANNIGDKILEDVNALMALKEPGSNNFASELDEHTGNSEELIETCYTSKVAMRFGAQELADLCAAAQNHNQHNDITGVLSYDQSTRSFMQILEGPKQPVEQLMKTIKKDRRHRDVTLRFQNNIKNRCYGRWSMYLVPSSNVGTEISN